MNYIKQYHHTTPKLIGKTNCDKYIYAICRCPVDTRYGLMVNKDDLTEYEKETGWCYIHCNNCRLDIEVKLSSKGE